MENTVIWRDVMNFNGVFAEAYHANSLGEVWSKDRYVTCTSKNGVEFRYLKKGRKLSPGITRGYLQIKLKCNGKKEQLFVHQVIAVCFPEICGEKFPGAEVDHRDGNRQNNRPENLWWVTRKQNMNNPITVDRETKSMTNNPKTSKPVLQFTLDGTFVAEYPSANEAARQTGFYQQNISAVCIGKNKIAYGFVWKYKEVV